MFEAMLISAGGLYLGLFGLIVFGSLLWASERDSFILGTAVIILSAVVAQFVFAIPVWAILTANLLMLGLYIVVYAAIGSLYTAMWRLPNFVKKNGDRIQRDYEMWTKDQKDWGRKKLIEENREEINVSFEKFLDSDAYRYSVRNNKDRVASWVLLWPASLTWELMHKPFIWIWDSVYFGMGKVFENINRNQARKILENNKK